MKAALGAKFELTWKQPRVPEAVKPQQRTTLHVLSQNISPAFSLLLAFTSLRCLDPKIVV